MTRRKGTKIKLLKGEKMIYIMLILLVISAPIVSVFTKAMLSESSIKLEYVKYEIEGQRAVNESLSMQIDELASLDKVQAIAKELGMSYNNNNVKVINDNE